MSNSGLPPAVQHLLWHELPSVDHVAVLLALRALGAGDALRVAAQANVAPGIAAAILHEFQMNSLVTQHGAEYRFEPNDALRDAAAQLAEMYHTKPVTLVRAIYDRPSYAIQQFADAFRLRRKEDNK
jgi:hypothetical protein